MRDFVIFPRYGSSNQEEITNICYLYAAVGIFCAIAQELGLYSDENKIQKYGYDLTKDNVCEELAFRIIFCAIKQAFVTKKEQFMVTLQSIQGSDIHTNISEFLLEMVPNGTSMGDITKNMKNILSVMIGIPELWKFILDMGNAPITFALLYYELNSIFRKEIRNGVDFTSLLICGTIEIGIQLTTVGERYESQSSSVDKMHENSTIIIFSPENFDMETGEKSRHFYFNVAFVFDDSESAHFFTLHRMKDNTWVANDFHNAVEPIETLQKISSIIYNFSQKTMLYHLNKYKSADVMGAFKKWLNVWVLRFGRNENEVKKIKIYDAFSIDYIDRGNKRKTRMERCTDETMAKLEPGYLDSQYKVEIDKVRNCHSPTEKLSGGSTFIADKLLGDTLEQTVEEHFNRLQEQEQVDLADLVDMRDLRIGPGEDTSSSQPFSTS